jgi:hypothetical protein
VTAARLLTIAATAYGAATVYGTAIAARHDIPGEPLGFRLPPLPVRWSLLLGMGAGTAIPWVMAATAAVAARAATTGNPVHARVCTALGAASVVGTLVEPTTWRRRAWSLPIAGTVAANLAASAALAFAGNQVARASNRAATWGQTSAPATRHT